MVHKLITIAVILIFGSFQCLTKDIQRPFSRKCEKDADCTFISSEQVRSSVYLTCFHGFCSCENSERQVSQMDDFTVHHYNGKCVVLGLGPCGSTNGIELTCENGRRDCVQGRCRSSQEIKRMGLDYLCYEDIDCQHGLKCQNVRGSSPPQYTCTFPVSSPA